MFSAHDAVPVVASGPLYSYVILLMAPATAVHPPFCPEGALKTDCALSVPHASLCVRPQLSKIRCIHAICTLHADAVSIEYSCKPYDGRQKNVGVGGVVVTVVVGVVDVVAEVVGELVRVDVLVELGVVVGDVERDVVWLVVGDVTSQPT